MHAEKKAQFALLPVFRIGFPASLFRKRDKKGNKREKSVYKELITVTNLTLHFNDFQYNGGEDRKTLKTSRTLNSNLLN